MRQMLRTLALLLLCVMTVVGGQDRRKEKMAEEERVMASKSFAELPKTESILDWTTILGDTSRFKGVEIAGSAIWINGYSNINTSSQFYGFKSTDNGATWNKWTVTLPNNATGVTNIAAKNASIAVMGTYFGDMIRTTDGGATWNVVWSYLSPTSSVPFFDAVKTIGASRDTMIAYGDADTAGLCVIRSLDAGATWTRIPKSALPATDSITYSEGWAALTTYGQPMDTYGKKAWLSLYWGNGIDPRMLVTTDAGTTWQVYREFLPGGSAYDRHFNSINFLNENVGFASARGLSSTSVGWYVKSTDGGKTWSDTISVEKAVPHTEAVVWTVVPVRGTANVFAGGKGSAGAKAWWSTDSGKTFTKLTIPASPATGEFWIAAFKDANNGYATGRQIALKLSTPNAIAEGKNGQPESYMLSQNYPNPFNPTTTIDYAIAKEGPVQLAVYDVLGRQVTTLVSAQQAAGHYSVRFDASHLSSGVYYYMLRAGDFVSTRSLVLMK